ncbi:hypothetical protein [Ancylobacter lacus]|uniref:hypothetical protein n=1 Tax=Ancylobacter lacus TaxID=2579970 RepID=UPI001BD09E00|nr:hypothetical protein [Ancylobacter lacus]MBS7539743.1 hypothetical protein [Ancylobacter lacus]
MSRALPASPALPPLLAWEMAKQLRSLRAEREGLLARLQRIDPRSTRRLAIERQLAALTTDILAAEVRLNGGTGP